MRDKELIIRHNPETGLWEEYKEPYMTIECQTEEDYLQLEKILDYWKNRPQWISVKDRLPEANGTYLIFTRVHFTPDHVDEIDYYDGIEISVYSKEFGFMSKNGLFAKAWMSLPEPPEDE